MPFRSFSRPLRTEDGPATIALKRTYCFGTCPVYKVTLRPSGKVYYEGEAHVPKIGKYTAEVHPDDFKKLAILAERIGFYRLRPYYDKSVTDQSTAISRIDRGVARAVKWQPVEPR